MKACFASSYTNNFVSVNGNAVNVDPDVAQLSAALGGTGSAAAATNEDAANVTAYNVPAWPPISSATIAAAVRAAAAASSPYAIPCAPTAVAAAKWVYGTTAIYGNSTSIQVYCSCPSGACSGTAE